MPRCYVNTNPTFAPAATLIAAITNANPATVTTTTNHNYITGNIVRLDIPVACGMRQANQLFGTITVTGLTTFTIPIDTTAFDPFVAPDPITTPINIFICAQCVPIGEQTILPDPLNPSTFTKAAVQNTLNLFQ